MLRIPARARTASGATETIAENPALVLHLELCRFTESLTILQPRQMILARLAVPNRRVQLAISEECGCRHQVHLRVTHGLRGHRVTKGMRAHVLYASKLACFFTVYHTA